MMVYRGHLIGPSDEKHPETGKTLYGISELKPALTPPLLISENACREYIKQVEPWDKRDRVDAYGRKRWKFEQPKKKKRDTRFGRCTKFLEVKYGSYET